MRVLFVIASVLFLLTGCVSKKVLVQEDLKYEEGLVHSKTTQIKKANQVVAYIVATHLNSIDKSFKDLKKEKFVIGLYASQKGGFDKELQVAVNDDLNTTTMRKLDINDPLLKVISSKNNWNNYYYVEGNAPDAKSVPVTFSADGYETKKLIFNRDYL